MHASMSTILFGVSGRAASISIPILSRLMGNRLRPNSAWEMLMESSCLPAFQGVSTVSRRGEQGCPITIDLQGLSQKNAILRKLYS